MLRRIFLLGTGLTLVLSSSLWARAEFHLGGVGGNSWQGLITDQEATYQVVDLEGNVLSTQPIAVGAEVAGIDTMLDYTAAAEVDVAPQSQLRGMCKAHNLASHGRVAELRDRLPQLQAVVFGRWAPSGLRRREGAAARAAGERSQPWRGAR